jgi:hypothetical protein
MADCPDCGARITDGETCRGLFDRLLAHEYAFPEAFGAVHHLTVAAYSLQHPRGYSRDAISMWRLIIAESLDGVSTPADFLARARAQFAGGVRVREPGAEPPDGWPRQWPMTAADVVDTPDAATHIDRVRQWAASIRAMLD